MRPGFWCECHSTNTRTWSASFDAYSPHQAVRWIRVALRTLTPGLDPNPADKAWQWLLRDYTHAVNELSQGNPYAFTLQHRTTTITWTARPVLYLPLAHRHSTQLPPCAERIDPTQLDARH